MEFSGVFKGYFPLQMTCFLCQNTHKTGNNAFKMLQAIHDISQFERFTDLNLFKYALNCSVIQN